MALKISPNPRASGNLTLTSNAAARFSSVLFIDFDHVTNVPVGALTKADDTNVTVTLGGTPLTALFKDVSITMGWTGTLAVSRGGTGGGTASGTLLDNITAFSSTGMIARTGAGAYSFRSLAPPAAGISVTNGDGVAGNPTLVLANDLAALEGLSSTGIAVRTATDTWAQRTLTAPAAGITVTNGNGVSGNPTLALADDLNALESLSGTGIARRTGTSTWTTGTTVSNAELATAADGTIKSNISGGVAAPSDNTISAVLDKLFGTTQGSVIYRGASTWAALAPGTSGYFLQTQGTSANPQWAAATVVSSTLTNSLAGDVALNNTANYFDGPSVAQGTTGTWLATGTVTLNDSAGGASFYAKLWDGTTVIAAASAGTTAAGARATIALSGYITSPAGNIRISVRDTTSVSGGIEANRTGNGNKDSTISVVRIA